MERLRRLSRIPKRYIGVAIIVTLFLLETGHVVAARIAVNEAAAAIPVVAQKDDTVPTSGYWTRTITKVTPCELSSGRMSGTSVPIGYQDTVLVSVSDHGKTISIAVQTLNLVKTGIYQTDYVPDKPETMPKGADSANFARLNVNSSEKFSFESGTSFRNLKCPKGAAFVTYDFAFVSADKPASEIGPVKPGFWSFKEIKPLESTCPEKSLSSVDVDADGFVTYIGPDTDGAYRLQKQPDKTYSVKLTADSSQNNSDSPISVTIKSDQSLIGTYKVPYTECQISFEGNFVREITLGKDAEQRAAVDTSIIPKSGIWTFTYTDQKIDGVCSSSLELSNQFDNLITVSKDGKAMTVGSLSSEIITRSENGYYIKSSGKFAALAKSPELLIIESQIVPQSQTCLVMGTGIATFKSAN
jgi:hypothetical protein